MTRVVDTPTRLSEVIWLFVELHAAWILMLLRKNQIWRRSSAWQFAGVSNTKPRSTWLIVLRHPRTSPVDSDYALPVVTNFLCCVTNSAHLVVGRWTDDLEFAVGWPPWHVVTSLSDVLWKHSCSLSTSVSSALEVCLRWCAIYIDIIYLSCLFVCLPTYLSTERSTLMTDNDLSCAGLQLWM